jgi:GLPGLI family protein
MKMSDTWSASANDEACYVNLKTKENFRQSFFLDKIIINVEPIDWTLTQETKKIGKYICYKATTTLKEEREGGGYLSDPIVAWYTLEIPVSFGIRNYSGLPGLTLELTQETEEGKLFYKAIKIELNPKKKIVIKKPKGKAISHKEFIELISRPRK